MLIGQNIIGSSPLLGQGKLFNAVNAFTGVDLPTQFRSATFADVEEATRLAWEAYAAFRDTDSGHRALFLGNIADEIEQSGDELISMAEAETGLSKSRLSAERARTVKQLRLFAQEVAVGNHLGLRLDAADPDRRPISKPELRLRNIGVGPVVVFGASNFPFAMSVAGGDTASAFAAGCPVIVKAHSAHPGTSEFVGKAVSRAVRKSQMPPGIFSMLFDAGFEIGQALVNDPRIQAVGFTGSRRGGLALLDIAAKRKRPIPVYAEMSSINPVILLPAALENRGVDIGKAFARSLTLGAGQFCTNPGLILAMEGPGLAKFRKGAIEAIHSSPAQTMLTPGILHAYRAGVTKLAEHWRVDQLVRGSEGRDNEATPALFETDADALMRYPELQDEVFGAAGLIVRCSNMNELLDSLVRLEGQLTVSLHVDQADYEAATEIIPSIESLAGRLIVNDFATGVEVSHAMVHGGPYPATSDGRATSVGTLAINRFLRPVSYQDFPSELLPRPFTAGPA